MSSSPSEFKSNRPIGSKRNVRVDVRVICASNRDLKHLVREGKFRVDLYYRLNVIQVQVPPLRERREDFCARAVSRQPGMTAASRW